LDGEFNERNNIEKKAQYGNRKYALGLGIPEYKVFDSQIPFHFKYLKTSVDLNNHV
jgi:hypothetical protein